MNQSIGQVALDIVIGKSTIASGITAAFAEARSIVNDNGATLTQKISAIGGTVSNVGATLLPLSTAMLGVGAACLKMATDFETSMAKLSTIADTSKVSMDTMKKAVKDLSNQTGISASQVANDTYDAISAGVDTASAVDFVKNSTKLATAGFADSGAALDVLTTILNAYGLKASEVTTVSDLLINTQNLGKTTVGDLASSMGKVIPTANAMGVGLDNLCAAYTITTAKGIATAESTTYINGMLNELGNSGTKVGQIIKKQTGKSFQELMASGSSLGDVLGILQNHSKKSGVAFNELWGSQEAGKAAMSLLSDGTEGFNKRLKEMQSTTGSTEAAFQKMSNTTEYKTNLAINKLKNGATDLGETLLVALLPTINRACDAVESFTNWFTNLDDETKNTIVSIGGVVAALGPVTIMIGKVISIGATVIGTLGKIITIGGKLVGVFKGIGSVIALVAGGAGTLGEAIAVVFPVLGSIGSTIAGVFSGIVGAVTSVGSAIGGVIAAINPVVAAIVAAVAAIVAAIVLVVKNWDTVKATTISAFNTVKDAIVGAFNSAKEGVSIAIGNIKTFVTTAWTNIKTAVVNVATSIVTTVSNTFSGLGTAMSGIWEGIKTVAGNAWTLVKNVILGPVLLIIDLVTGNFTKLKSDASNIMNNIKTAMSNIWDGIKNIFTNAGQAIVIAVKGKFTLMKQGVEFIINGLKTGLSTAWQAIKTTITTVATNLKDSVVTTFTNLKTNASQLFENMKTAVTTTFNNIKTGITNTANNIKNAIVEAFKKGVDYIKSLPSQAITWGKDFVDGLVKGIKASISKVTEAATSVADKIRSILHFSVPDEGPLTDYETWMPDFMQGLANGINSNRGLVTQAINSLANDMVINPGVSVKAPKLAYTRNNTSTLQNNSSGDTDRSLIEMLLKIIEKLDNISDMDMVIDGDTLVGKLTPTIDRELGTLVKRKRRGN